MLTRRQFFSTRFLQDFFAERANPSAYRPIARWDEHTEADSPRGDHLNAYVNRQHCMAWNRVPCTTCHERCPESGALTLDEGRPSVVQDRCTGCGICHDVCPAPVNAILMIPRKRFSRAASHGQ